MSAAHLINLGIHVATGTVALAIGFTMLAKTKGTAWHRRMGRVFCYVTLVVSGSAIVGAIFFRFVPIFAVLSILVPYQLIGGWRSVYTKDRGPALIDAAWTLVALGLSLVLIPILLAHPTKAPIVVYSSLGALAAMLTYDTIRWLFPRRWYRLLWKYEHGYKVIASIFAMLSALVGNLVRMGQPWSQIAPSALGVVVILYFFVKIYRQKREVRFTY
ncbi:MAG: hypothetical protein ABI767_13960 [Rhodanobacter sp.]